MKRKSVLIVVLALVSMYLLSFASYAIDYDQYNKYSNFYVGSPDDKTYAGTYAVKPPDGDRYGYITPKKSNGGFVSQFYENGGSALYGRFYTWAELPIQREQATGLGISYSYDDTSKPGYKSGYGVNNGHYILRIQQDGAPAGTSLVVKYCP